MKEAYLEVTYRHAEPLAAYYYLPIRGPRKSVRTQRIEPGLVVDFSAGGKPLGIEITAPNQITFAGFNRVLRSLRCSPLRRGDLAPLHAA